MNLPGYDHATDLGYQCHSHSGDKSKATYTNGDLTLEVWKVENGLRARISSVVGMITLTTGEIAFPHPRFKSLFEKQMLQATEGARKAVDQYIEGLV